MIRKPLTLPAGTLVRSPGMIAQLVGRPGGIAVDRLTLTEPVTVDALYLPQPLSIEGDLADLGGVARFLGFHAADVEAGRQEHALDAVEMPWRASEVTLPQDVSAPAGSPVQAIIGQLAPLVFAQALAEGGPLAGGALAG